MAKSKKPVSLLDIREFTITIVGDSSLICHNWDEKVKKQIKDKHLKKPATKKEKRDPEAEFRASLYPMPGGNGYGFPAIAFKSAAVDACSHIDGVTKVLARGAFHINEELLKIEADEPTMREDMVRIAMGTADLRFRGEFKKWKILIPIRYNASVLSPDQIVNIFNTAGFAVGMGEMRPARNGSSGMFHVEEVEIPVEESKSKNS